MVYSASYAYGTMAENDHRAHTRRYRGRRHPGARWVPMPRSRALSFMFGIGRHARSRGRTCPGVSGPLWPSRYAGRIAAKDTQNMEGAEVYMGRRGSPRIWLCYFAIGPGDRAVCDRPHFTEIPRGYRLQGADAESRIMPLENLEGPGVSDRVPDFTWIYANLQRDVVENGSIGNLPHQSAISRYFREPRRISNRVTATGPRILPMRSLSWFATGCG